jgi:hypothetical protein
LYWNVKDLDAAGQPVKLENQPVVSGVSLFPRRTDLPTGFGSNSGQVMDGVEVILNGSYDAPITPLEYEIETTAGSTITVGSTASRTVTVFNDYTLFGLPTSWSIDGFGFGTTDLNKLQQDYEIRYTGILRYNSCY